jgi:hexosaminidase
MRHSLIPLSTLALLATAHAAPNPAPDVVPALRTWVGDEGSVSLKGSAIVVDTAHRAELEPLANQWSDELRAAGLGEHAVRVATTAAAGEIFLTLANAANLPNAESYSVAIHAGRPVTISGKTRSGAFYGTRTIQQMLVADKAGLTVPRGEITDFPTYRGRMLMVDVGRKPTPLAVIKDYIRMLGYYKFNEFHLHLSDEAFGGKYTGFRIVSDTFPGLANTDVAYTKKELRELQDFAKARGVTITPEIDMPGHSGCFTKYWPEIMLKDSTGKVYPNYMDVTNPKTIEYMKRLLDELIPIFDAPDFHIGTDEYRVGGPDREKLHESFRQFINTMNAHIRSRGKNMRIWSGFEHMKGTTQIDPTVIIDMWETDDAKGAIAKGHKVINSNHGRTYIVPGAHYYGVSNPGIYGGWEPWMVSGNNAKNPSKDDPGLIGGKLHVWADQGPTGWTTTEIADVTRTSLQAFGEKLWGTKGSPDYKQFRVRADKLMEIPGATAFERPLGTPIGIPGDAELSSKDEYTLGSPDTVVKLPWTGRFEEKNLPYPWTLSFEVMKTAETGKRCAIFSSDLMEIAADYTRDDEVKSKDPKTGKEVKTKVPKTGLGIIRAASGYTRPDDPLAAKSESVSRVCGPKLPLNKWVKVSIGGFAGKTVVYVDGVKTGESNNQTVCPLDILGSRVGESLVGKVRNISIRNRAPSDKDAARDAGIAVPVNLADGKPATASATDKGAGLTAYNLTDGNTGTRWSSAPTSAPAWVKVDLGMAVPVGRVKINWENAFAKSYAIEVSTDGETWLPAAKGTGRAGVTNDGFGTATARFVRVTMEKPATSWGYSIREIEVFPSE